MTPEALRAQFDVMAEAPNGVQKMRELVLQLAVRGKLVPQSADEEPARALLDRIAVVRKLAQQSPSDELPIDVVVPYTIPETWCWVQLSALGAIVGGGTPKTGVAEYWSDDGVPWLTPADLNGLGSKYARAGRRHVTELGLADSSAQLLPPGAVLFSSRAPIGYVAIAQNALATNQGFKSCVPYHEGLSEYLYRFLQAVAPEIDRNAPGTTFREVSGKIVGQILVPVPPLAEQRRIVAKVDELMALCDELEVRQRRRAEARVRANRSVLHHLVEASGDEELAAGWERLRENFGLLFDTRDAVAYLRQVVRQLGIRGRLTSQEPRHEPATVLIDRIAKMHHSLGPQRSRSRPPSSASADVADAPFVLPRGWCWTNLGALISTGPQNGYSPRAVERETAVRTLTLSATTTGQFEGRHYKYVDEVIAPDSSLWLRDGDLLFQRGNTLSYVGIAAIYEGPPHTYIFPDLMIRVRCSEHVDGAFIHLAANSDVGRMHFTRRASGTSGSMPKISQADVLELPVPLPPASEQEQIVAKVGELMRLCDSLDTQLAHARDRSARLVECVVHHLTTA